MMVYSMLVDFLFTSALYKIHLDPLNLNAQIQISRRPTNNHMFQTIKKDTHESVSHYQLLYVTHVHMQEAFIQATLSQSC